MSPPQSQRNKHPSQHIDHQLSVLFDNTKEFKICMLDRAGRIVGWNLSAEKLTGYTEEDVLMRNYSMFLSREESEKGVLKRALATAGKTGQYIAEGILVRKDGSHFWSRSVITPLKGADRSILFFVVITQDISLQKHEEQKKDEYIGIASHELKNPITTLSLYSELLAKRLQFDQDKENLHMLRDIQGQAARLVNLVDDLLVVGNIESDTLVLHKEDFSMQALARRVVTDFRKSVTTHVITVTGTCSRDVRADKSRIAQILINLVSNAVKYSPQAKRVVVHLRARNGKCEVSVQDFGAGIAKSEHRDIFTRFFRSKDAESGDVVGTGLGLYIAKSIIKKHRERIWLKSRSGKGSTFFFTVPLSR